MAHSIDRVQMTVDGVPHALAPLETADDLRRQILTAVHGQGGFLTFTADDGVKMSILVTSATSVTISVVTVQLIDALTESHGSHWSPPETHYEDDMPFDLF